MIQTIISQKIAEFLANEAKQRNLDNSQVEAGIKLQETKDKNGEVKSIRPYFFLRVNGKFERYVELDELL